MARWQTGAARPTCMLACTVGPCVYTCVLQHRSPALRNRRLRAAPTQDGVAELCAAPAAPFQTPGPCSGSRYRLTACGNSKCSFSLSWTYFVIKGLNVSPRRAQALYMVIDMLRKKATVELGACQRGAYGVRA
jgi:hypothetical protein